MKFPLTVNEQLTISKKELRESDLETLIKQVEEGLEYLRMDVRRIAKNELYFSHLGLMGSFSQKDYLQNLFVSIELNNNKVKIKLESNTTFLLIIGLIPLTTLFFPTQKFVTNWLWLLSFPTLTIGFALRINILGNIKKKLVAKLID